MAYIYIIKNTVNSKVYIGKTELDIEKRFIEHIADSKRERCEKRPLYNAMNKYGSDKFSIHLIEETNNPEEREIYWIEKYNSYKYGYNATKGGDGKRYIDYDLVISMYHEFKNAKEVSRRLNIDYSGVLKILKNNNVKRYRPASPSEKPILMYSTSGIFLREFFSAGEASRYIVKEKLTTTNAKNAKIPILHCANGISKSAYGFLWKWKEESSE